MPYIGPVDQTQARFLMLVGMVRHEYWLHQLAAEDYDLRADATALTLSAKRHDDAEMPCVYTVTKAELEGDLHSLARKFFKEICGGSGNLKTPSGR